MIIISYLMAATLRWRHFCVVYDSAEENIEIYADSRLTFRKEKVQAVTGTRFQDNLLSSITLGNYHYHYPRDWKIKLSENHSLMAWEFDLNLNTLCCGHKT